MNDNAPCPALAASSIGCKAKYPAKVQNKAAAGSSIAAEKI